MPEERGEGFEEFEGFKEFERVGNPRVKVLCRQRTT
jgi:hypothetical protein